MENEKIQDVETESLKLAIEQIADDETAALPHIEQLSSAVAENTGDTTAQAGSRAADTASILRTQSPDAPHETERIPDEPASHRPSGQSHDPHTSDGQDRISTWFLTFMCMNIPVIGWIYLFYLAFSKKKRDRRNFARAYLFYKLVFLVAGLVILAVVAVTAMNLLEELLDYMQML